MVNSEHSPVWSDTLWVVVDSLSSLHGSCHLLHVFEWGSRVFHGMALETAPSTFFRALPVLSARRPRGALLCTWAWWIDGVWHRFAHSQGDALGRCVGTVPWLPYSNMSSPAPNICPILRTQSDENMSSQMNIYKGTWFVYVGKSRLTIFPMRKYWRNSR